MTGLKVVYASAPTEELIIGALEIFYSGEAKVRVCTDFAPWLLGVDGQFVEFEGGPITVSLPGENASGNQPLTFAVSGVGGRVQRIVDDALETGGVVWAIYREYLASNTVAPARRPYRMNVVGGYFENPDAAFECSYYDMLNSAWPREPYTQENAPGIKYL